MTLEEIRDEIVTDLGLDPADEESNARVLTFIKAGLRRLPRHVRDRALTTIASDTLEAGNYTMCMPANFAKERELWHERDGKRIRIQRATNQQAFHDEINKSAYGQPDTYRVVGKTIEFNRRADQNYTIYIDYHKVTSINNDLTSVDEDDTFAGREDMVETFKELVKGLYIKDYEEDPQRAAGYLSIAQTELQKMSDDYMEQEMGGHIEEA